MRRTILIVLFSILVIYSIYQGRFLILGPQIWVDNIKDGETVAEPVITVAGRAKNVAWISLNDRQIFTDEEGYWSEKLVVSEGVSFISIKARDRFGHEVNKNLQIVLN
ncbi:MAG: hypothetical protein A2832_00630 [Candidatus Zambryskibacteria bacterium RIFCSPHIGHO2_01_FULL_44_22b]|uniref:Bacterial Ig domain-containing protein n=2 Tax=Candidatus Zambryskiibacteriota TaxID=1817925 RepID=A0A1G2T2Z2_9BACT|nr:MAG: hypothetical protein A2832_00630 [Candidatus Zambryskibacteria bacterium RIFCSPHIGHO2_01_FULL_44_22b]OHB06392.1 MAG: hypothetical protein A3B16_00305 [Candidatus Zambryskibacteria bacterium RIFCSPLOWO2_01_FULL_45_43]